MKRLMSGKIWLAGIVVAAGGALALAQDAAPKAAAVPPVAKPPAAAAPAAPARTPHRPLAPGVLQRIDPSRQQDETYSRHDIMELLAVDPNFEWAKDATVRHDIWALEFQFKPMRLIWVDVPQPNDVMRKTLVLYLVYTVSNTGKVMHAVEQDNTEPKTFKVEASERPVRLFVPEFLLASREDDRAYRDRVIPVAAAAIQVREDRTRRLYTTPEMTRKIGVGETIWGVATWDVDMDGTGQGIDPRIDRYSVYITGLTNAYRWKDDPSAFKVGDPPGKGRKIVYKRLKLNFWRAGDEYFPHEKEIRYGIPGDLDYEWVWR